MSLIAVVVMLEVFSRTLHPERVFPLFWTVNLRCTSLTENERETGILSVNKLLSVLVRLTIDSFRNFFFL